MPLRPRLALLLATACQSPPASETSFGGQGDTTTAATTAADTTHSVADDTSSTSTGSSTGALPADSSTTTAGSTDPAIFDLGTDHDLGSPAPAGCQGKVDLLFVVARDGWVDEGQKQLIAAFPPLMARLGDTFADFDPHVMVVNSEPFWGDPSCNDDCDQQVCEDIGYPCDKLGLVTWCDRAMGAGTVFNAGDHAANKPCKIANGRRFLTREQPDLAATFACIAQVGGSGYGDMGDAIMNAMTSQLSGPGGCNDKFFRKDALLLITFIGGADMQGIDSKGTPEQWTEAVLDAKQGDYGSVVMLSIGISEPDCPWWGDRICTLANGFPYHHVADAKATNYTPAFEAAAALVHEACTAFIPPPV